VGDEGRAAADQGDVLPAQLDITSGYVGPYLFPNNKRRRIAAVVYLLGGAGFVALWALRAHGGVAVNVGLLAGGVAFAAVGVYHLLASYPLVVRELDALGTAARQVGFPIGHASAQLGWRGLRSRPTWRVLVYSADDPPAKRGLVLVDGVDASVVAYFVEDNPEDWSGPEYRRT